MGCPVISDAYYMLLTLLERHGQHYEMAKVLAELRRRPDHLSLGGMNDARLFHPVLRAMLTSDHPAGVFSTYRSLVEMRIRPTAVLFRLLLDYFERTRDFDAKKLLFVVREMCFFAIQPPAPEMNRLIRVLLQVCSDDVFGRRSCGVCVVLLHAAHVVLVFFKYCCCAMSPSPS